MARKNLIRISLIAYQKPIYQVLDLTQEPCDTSQAFKEKLNSTLSPKQHANAQPHHMNPVQKPSLESKQPPDHNSMTKAPSRTGIKSIGTLIEEMIEGEKNHD